MSGFLKLLFPEKCMLCREVTLLDIPFCRSCLPEFSGLFSQDCPGCGRRRTDCTCPGKDVPFLFYYHSSPSKKAIAAVKHDSNIYIIRFFALLISKKLKNVKKPDCITWPPRSRKNINKYGYDQSRLLAVEISKITGIPCVKLLERTGRAVEQKLLSASQRRKNMKNIFKAAGDAGKYKRVLLLDDIMTTGATLAECAGILRSAGIKEVKPFCIAKTPKIKRFKPTKNNQKYYVKRI